jgi:ParB/RepB/Spo0J family partition protein
MSTITTDETGNQLYETCKNLVPVEIPLDEIFSDSEFNCRGNFTVADVMTLANDIATRSLQSPIMVMPYDEDGYKFKIVAGHRRYAAFRHLKKKTIPAVIREHLTPIQASALNLIENIQRKDLNIVQEAQGLQHLIDAGLNVSRMADYLGVSTGWVSTRMNLLALPPSVQVEAAAGNLTQSHINHIYKHCPLINQMEEFMAKVKRSRALGEKFSADSEKPKIAPVKNIKVVRDVASLTKAQGVIRDAIGSCLATRVLAYAIGNITDQEFYQCVKEEADAKGIAYIIPDEYR